MNRKNLYFIVTSILVLYAAAFAQKPEEIVFSTLQISADNPVQLTNEFKVGETIYGMAYFNKTIAEFSRNDDVKKISAEIFIYELKPPLYSYQQPSEVQLEANTVWVSGDLLQKKYLPVDIIPKSDATTAYGNPAISYEKFGSEFYGPVKFAKAIAKLGTGKHTLIIKVRCGYAEAASGKLTIEGEDYSVYKKMAGDLNSAADNIKTGSAIMPKAAMSDKKLEVEMISVFKNSQTYKDRINAEVVKLVIIDPDWYIRRNELTGVVLHRYIRAAIATKGKDGTCMVWQNVTFQQDFVGNKFQKTKFDGVGDPFKIPCENVNK